MRYAMGQVTVTTDTGKDGVRRAIHTLFDNIPDKDAVSYTTVMASLCKRLPEKKRR